jgi:hypothetical protein
MTIAYKNYLTGNASANTTVYNPTAANIQATLIGLTICNNSGVNAAYANVVMYSASTSANIVLNVSIPVGTSLNVIDSNRMIVQQNNIITVTATSSVDVIVSSIEVT